MKNEGVCDASWAFAVTALVEGDHFIRAGTLFNLSEQELLDCTGSGSGCGGGSPIGALRTLIAKGGLANRGRLPLYRKRWNMQGKHRGGDDPGCGTRAAW